MHSDSQRTIIEHFNNLLKATESKNTQETKYLLFADEVIRSELASGTKLSEIIKIAAHDHIYQIALNKNPDNYKNLISINGYLDKALSFANKFEDLDPQTVLGEILSENIMGSGYKCLEVLNSSRFFPGLSDKVHDYLEPDSDDDVGIDDPEENIELTNVVFGKFKEVIETFSKGVVDALKQSPAQTSNASFRDTRDREIASTTPPSPSTSPSAGPSKKTIDARMLAAALARSGHGGGSGAASGSW